MKQDLSAFPRVHLQGLQATPDVPCTRSTWTESNGLGSAQGSQLARWKVEAEQAKEPLPHSSIRVQRCRAFKKKERKSEVLRGSAQVSLLAGWKLEAEQAKAAADGVARQAAALTQRATALSHLQRLPAELQVRKFLSVFLNSSQSLHLPWTPRLTRFPAALTLQCQCAVSPPPPACPAAGALHHHGCCAPQPAHLPPPPAPCRSLVTQVT